MRRSVGSPAPATRYFEQILQFAKRWRIEPVERLRLHRRRAVRATDVRRLPTGKFGSTGTTACSPTSPARLAAAENWRARYLGQRTQSAQRRANGRPSCYRRSAGSAARAIDRTSTCMRPTCGAAPAAAAIRCCGATSIAHRSRVVAQRELFSDPGTGDARPAGHRSRNLGSQPAPSRSAQ